MAQERVDKLEAASLLPEARAHRARDLGRWLPLVPVLLFLLGFFVAPIGELLHRSATDGSSAYYKIFTDTYYLAVVGRTFMLSAVVTAISTLLGYPVAYFLVRHRSRWHRALIVILLLPLLTSLIMRTYGWQIVLARQGLLNTLLIDLGVIDAPIQMLQTYSAVVIGYVHLFIPFSVISIASVLQTIDLRIEEAAVSLGASRFATFRRITLPLSIDGIVTGALLVFMMCNGAFVTALLLGGNSVITIPLLIYQQFTLTRDFQTGSALSTVLLASSALCLFLQLSLTRKPYQGRAL
ncbi:ABC transporter permease [Mesorhizobium sp. B2-6-5]|uniref:ABC transporter permease n=1 Tax=Mesorhizobium sp. B2-6-5 TaxID=2589912 RepID=UPI0011285346|nr:ABC transporter permease [Mesorhizobium sp. B2-6-5]TPJ38277.1 ABC transporter permease [Mesorhizobium sp. B2-6-5]